MTFNPTIHHRKSIRLQGYDYSREGLYFITICIKDRLCLFGKIDSNGMQLNNLGKIVNECWLAIPEHFPNAELHEYIIMPNHIHGIIELNNDGNDDVVGGVFTVGVENIQPLPQQPPRRHEFQKIIPRSIGSIVKGFKIGVTKWCRNNSTISNLWQRNYHEHIVRDKTSYVRISEYIVNNPKKWKGDKFYIK